MGVLVAVVVAASCSSHPPAADTSTSPPASAEASTVAVQHYLDAVNRLCDELLPKVIAVTGGGSLDIPLHKFFKQLPEHSRLRAEFDRNLARIPVPAAARAQARALRAYIGFANRLDARRLAAARQGLAAYAREIRAEQSSAASDPTIAARDAAGFHDSCNAR
jgi:hypothetical protein